MIIFLLLLEMITSVRVAYTLSGFIQIQFYPDDIVWEAEDCICTSVCCQLNNPPWFIKNLPVVTTDDIELWLCTIGEPVFDDVLELIKLYVQ